MRRAAILAGGHVVVAVADDDGATPPAVASAEVGCLYPIPDQPGRLYRHASADDVAAAVFRALTLAVGCDDVLVIDAGRMPLWQDVHEAIVRALRTTGTEPTLVAGHPIASTDLDGWPASMSAAEQLAARYVVTAQALDADARAAHTEGHRLTLPRRAPVERAPRPAPADAPPGAWARVGQPASAAAGPSTTVHEVTLGVDPGSAWVGVVALRGTSTPAEAILQRTYEVGERRPLATPRQVGGHLHTHRRVVEQHHVDAIAAAVVAHAAEVGATRAVVEQIDSVHFSPTVEPGIASATATALLRTTWIATTIAAALRAAGIEVHGVTQASARALVVGRAAGKRGGSSPERIPGVVAEQVTGWDPRADEHARDAAVYALWCLRQRTPGAPRVRAPRARPSRAERAEAARARRRAEGCTCTSTRRHTYDCEISRRKRQEAREHG